MHIVRENLILRKPEPKDVEALYVQKNDSEIAGMLGGFSKGYSRADLARWVDFHVQASNEALYIMADGDDRCLGHIGFYNIDHRARSAEFAIMLGDKKSWGTGVARACSVTMFQFGFLELHLHRVNIQILESNPRSIRLYASLGFKEEGRLRDAQWKQGRYIDLIPMALLEDEWDTKAGGPRAVPAR